jgi:hypothetical protein
LLAPARKTSQYTQPSPFRLAQSHVCSGLLDSIPIAVPPSQDDLVVIVLIKNNQ